MFDPSKIVNWFDEHFQSIRRSRRSALASIVYGAMQMRGSGVLALGRAMEGATTPKHCIKRVDRFLGNDRLEMTALFGILFSLLRGTNKSPVILVDWTDRHTFKQLVFAVSKDGRALPFLWVTIKKEEFESQNEGPIVEAQCGALGLMAAICPKDVFPIFIADRGFGNARWITDIQNRGWYFVQRLAKNHYMKTTEYIGVLSELGIRRGWKPRDWGWGSMGELQQGKMRLVTVYARDAEGPWYVVTNLENTGPKAIVRLYAKRMWIEAMFRDLKSRKWGLGIDEVRLSDQMRTTRHFVIVAIAYLLLCAFGAVAEARKLAETIKANTVKRRTLALASIGNYLLKLVQRVTIPTAIQSLCRLPN
jgi:hypothetical protein